MSDLMSLVADIRSDFRVNTSGASRTTAAVWRFGMWAHHRRDAVGFVGRRVHDVVDAVWTRGVIGAELPGPSWSARG